MNVVIPSKETFRRVALLKFLLISKGFQHRTLQFAFNVWKKNAREIMLCYRLFFDRLSYNCCKSKLQKVLVERIFQIRKNYIKKWNSYVLSSKLSKWKSFVSFRRSILYTKLLFNSWKYFVKERLEIVRCHLPRIFTEWKKAIVNWRSLHSSKELFIDSSHRHLVIKRSFRILWRNYAMQKIVLFTRTRCKMSFAFKNWKEALLDNCKPKLSIDPSCKSLDSTLHDTKDSQATTSLDSIGSIKPKLSIEVSSPHPKVCKCEKCLLWRNFANSRSPKSPFSARSSGSSYSKSILSLSTASSSSSSSISSRLSSPMTSSPRVFSQLSTTLGSSNQSTSAFGFKSPRSPAPRPFRF